MPIVNELTTLLNYQVDTSGLGAVNGALNGVGQSIRRIGQWFGSLGTAVRQGLVEGTREGYQQWKQLNAEQKKSQRNVQQLGEGYNQLGLYLKGLLATVGLLSTTRIADEWAGVEGRISLAVNDSELKPTLQAIYQIAQAAGQEYVATANLFQTVARNQKDLAISTEDSLKLTEVIGKAMTIGGGSAESQQAALVQLGQALGSGVLRGDELNSILEQSPRLAQAIADSFGVSVGQLRQLGSEGKLTSKELAQGLLKQAEKLEAEFEKMPKTFARGFTIVQNAWGRLINGLNKASRASEYFYRVCQLIADNLADIARVGALAGVAAALTTLRGLAWAAVAPFLRMFALVSGLYLLLEDFSVWLEGGQSVFGRLFGERAVWQTQIDAVMNFFEWLKDMLGDNNKSITEFLLKWGSIATVGYAILRVVGMIFRGLAFLWGPVKLLIQGIIYVVGLLASIVGWPALIAAAVVALAVLIYKYFDEIKTFINGVWDSVAAYFTDIWTKAINKVVELAKRLLPEKFFLDQEEASKLREQRGSELNPYRQDQSLYPGAAIQQSGMAGNGASYQDNKVINNNVTVNAPTNNPAALANTAADAVGQATTRSLPAPALPNVEVLP